MCLFDRTEDRINISGPGRVFSGSGIWPKYGAGFGKTRNILTGFGIWLLPGKRDSPKFGHGMRDFFACLSGIREIATTQVNVLAAKANQPGERKISMDRPIYNAGSSRPWYFNVNDNFCAVHWNKTTEARTRIHHLTFLNANHKTQLFSVWSPQTKW